MNKNLGVIYNKNDHVPFFKRIAIICIDVPVLISLFIISYICLEYFDKFVLDADNYFIHDNFEFFYAVLTGALIFIYLTIIQRSKYGTLGYLL